MTGVVLVCSEMTVVVLVCSEMTVVVLVCSEMTVVVLVCFEMTGNRVIFSLAQKCKTQPLYLAECYPERIFP